MTVQDDHENHRGVLQSTVELFLDSARAVAQVATQTGSAGAHAVLPDPVMASVDRMLSSLRTVAEQAPQITNELDILISEVHAKRLTIQAVTAELAVLDQQLEILEKTLAPVQTWSNQWSHLQRSLLSSLKPPAEPTEPAE